MTEAINSQSAEKKLFPLSVVVLTKNVEDKLEDCLKSCQWVDDVVVVDSGSRDRTIEIAKRYGAYVINQGWMGYGLQRRFAVSQAAHDWVLCIDADERLTPELSESIREALSRPDIDKTGPHLFAFPRRNWFMGRFLKHGNGYPDWQPRLFNRNFACWSDAPVEETIESKEKPARLRGDLIHYPTKNFMGFLKKQLRYSHIRAEYLYSQGAKPRASKLLLSPLCRFLRNYVLRAGFLDGAPGFVYIACGCINSFAKHARLLELAIDEQKKQQDKKEAL